MRTVQSAAACRVLLRCAAGGRGDVGRQRLPGRLGRQDRHQVPQADGHEEGRGGAGGGRRAEQRADAAPAGAVCAARQGVRVRSHDDAHAPWHRARLPVARHARHVTAAAAAALDARWNAARGYHGVVCVVHVC